ncbi:iron-containing alcohol dehydrogenase [Bacillus sp. FJAT-27231]|uniref:iron-containing alcohol dehydrogenase n=1 Tax=Bacillus sp. FJAT-27231 TaxID=1679168 RepID=UPI001E4A69CF|nr:iron-containing alcohol dehydrogenase [Bacillus sp. FJAT-27231]
MESYTSDNASPVSQGLAIQAVKMIVENLTKTYFVETDIESRGKMLLDDSSSSIFPFSIGE